MRHYREIPTDFSPRFFCPKCKAMHDTQTEARKCDASDEAPAIAVGEIVLIDVGYGWYDGDVNWLVLNTDTFHGRPTHSAFFVITAIDYDRGGYQPHSPRYHVKTRGILNGNPTGLAGYTGGSHKTMRRVRNTLHMQTLKEEGAQFIGEKTEHLI